MKEILDTTITAAFTGHRRFDYRQKDAIKSRLTAAIIESYEQGYRNFISGFAQGFDMLAAECVAELKALYPDMKLFAAIPSIGHSSYLFGYTRQMYNHLLAHCDKTFNLSDHYFDRCFLARDEFMVRNSSRLIAFFDGRGRGGTFYTVRYARHRNIPIYNIYPQTKMNYG